MVVLWMLASNAEIVPVVRKLHTTTGTSSAVGLGKDDVEAVGHRCGRMGLVRREIEAIGEHKNGREWELADVFGEPERRPAAAWRQKVQATDWANKDQRGRRTRGSRELGPFYPWRH